MEGKILETPYPEGEDIGIDEFSVTYVQSPDTNDSSEHYQRLKVSTVSTFCSEHEPYYLNIEILPFEDGTPGHWSLNLDEGIGKILDDFMQRLRINTKQK